MKLAKPQVDIGLSTNDPEPMLAFWQGTVGLKLDHVLPVRRGQNQHRHDALGSVVKINHHADPLPDAAPSGYRELIIAQPARTAPQPLQDPDGNRVCLVPPGHDGIRQIGIRVVVRDLDAHRRFYRDALGLRELSRSEHEKGRFTLVFLAAPGDDDAQVELTYNWDPEPYPGGRNFGHLAYAVDDIYAACRRLMDHGVTINRPPRDGRMAFVRSPDNVSIELLQKDAALPPAEPWASMPNTGKW